MLQNLSGRSIQRRQIEGDTLNLKASLVNTNEPHRILQIIGQISLFSQTRFAVDALDASLCRRRRCTVPILEEGTWKVEDYAKP